MIHKQDLLDWRTDVTVAAAKAMDARLPLDGAVSVDCMFFLARPKSAPVRVVWPIKRPDVDKLARGILDALVFGGVLADDSQVVTLRATKHFVGDQMPTAGVTVMVAAL